MIPDPATTTDQNPPLLVMRDMRKTFGATRALDGISFSVNAGEVVALVGENGAGKSTLMRVLSGAIRPDGGTMELDGALFRPHDPLDARRSGVAMVYQELSVAPHLTAEENIVLGVEPVRRGLVDRAESRRLAAEALHILGATDLTLDAPAGSLSLAERQLIEIARAVANHGRIFVLDEPTSALTAGDTAKLFQLIRKLRSEGRAIIFISHFLEEVREIADRFVVLRDGRSVGEGRTTDVSMRDLASMMVGREVAELFPRSARSRGEPVLDVGDLAGDPKPVSASFVLHRGEVLGIAGLSGAGRSELLRAIFGLEPVRSGRIAFGHYHGPALPSQRWRQGMGMVSEDRAGEGLALDMSIADNVTLSRLDVFGRAGVLVPSLQREAARRWIERVHVRCSGPQQTVSQLSGGNQQKVALARLLHHEVDVLLLDEPTRGIDVGSKAEIYRMIDELAAGGKAVVMVSSYLPELLGVCDRIAVMSRGRLHPPRSVSETDEHEIMREATGAV